MQNSLERQKNQREESREREDAVQASRRKRMVWPGVLTDKLMRTGGSGLDCGEAENPQGVLRDS